ncbi:MAG TPA: hypothetical protein VK498_16360 [Ferruginibacter sp.]|nr:hypothetical protein [Ferruginibacter sp.]
MEINTDEDHLDNPTNTESGIPPDEIILTKDSEAIIPNQETENMEVHHHSHSTHGKKNWKSYFWEFLMLFLAVFCGFLAEYQLEHIIEKQRAKQYIYSIYEDLKIDNNQLQTLIPQFKEKDKQLDTMLLRIRNITSATGANGIYKYIHEVANYPDFVYTDRTIQQLKNSGSLRLITNKEVSDNIIGYDASVKMMNIHVTEAIAEQIHVIRQMNTKLFDMRCCPKLGKNVPLNSVDYPNPGTLLTYNENIIVEYFNNVQEMKRNYTIQREILEKLLKENIHLQEFLKNEYHIE